jgi:branched-chain amino acid transport system permease protein
MSVLGLAYHSQFVGPALVVGLAAAGLYGLLSLSLVLTYRVSRTIGFVQGGLAILGAYLYWWLTYDTGATTGFGISQPRMGRVPGLIIVVLVGALIGLVYGVAVTGKRMASWPRLNMTIFSLAWLLGLVATAVTTMTPQEARLPSAFGRRTYKLLGAVITIHQVVTLVILVGMIAFLAFVLTRTQTGINIRAIADDVEASRYVGVPLSNVGTGVYVFAGALSAFAGALLTSTAGVTVTALLVVFLRALTVSVLGGFTSFSLALAGCALLGVGESQLTAGTFGPMSGGEREILIVGVLFVLVLVINRLRPIKVLEAQGL